MDKATLSPLVCWLDAVGRMTGYRRLATRCGVPWQSVQYWAKTGRVPSRHLANAEAETGIVRQRLNPEPFRSATRAA